MNKKTIRKILLAIIIITLICFLGSKIFKSSKVKSINTPKTSDEYKEVEDIYEEMAKNALIMPVEEIEEQNRLLREELADEPSDIEGMTKLDKMEAGLSIEDGADSDQDGLTDKEEIEVYHSDPRKKSTSDDLYTDGYKVEHDMDLNTAYEYEGEKFAKGNKCKEVTLYIDDIHDLSAVVEDRTGSWQFMYADVTSASWLGDLNILKEYDIYNYTGPVDIDLTDISKESGIEADNIAAMLVMSNYAKMWNPGLNENFNYTIEDGILKIEDHNFYSGPILMLYEDTKQAEDSIGLKSSVLDSITSDIPLLNDSEGLLEEASITSEEGGDVLITFNIFSAITRGRPTIRYTSTGNPEEDAEIIEGCIQVAKILSDADLDNSRIDPLEINSSHCKEISPRMYKFLDGFYRTFMPDYMTLNWASLFTIIDTQVLLDAYAELDNVPLQEFNLKNGMRYKIDRDKGIETLYDANGRSIWSAKIADDDGRFNPNRDRFPFKNFGTEMFPAGHCAGLTQVVNIAYNTGNLESSGFYTSKKDKNTVISWNLLSSDDKDNRELIEDNVLINYKDSNFVDNHEKSISGGTTLTGLTKGELEFVNMVEAYHLQINETNRKSKYAGETNYSYELIEEMVKRLDEGKILGCSMYLFDYNSNGPDGKKYNDEYYENALYFLGGHAINIYDYKKIDDNTIHFYVYDTNLSDQDLYKGDTYFAYNSKDEGFAKPSGMYIRVTRVESDYDHHDTFEYMYQPLPETYNCYYSTNQGLEELSNSRGLGKLHTEAGDQIITDGKIKPNEYRFAVWDETGDVFSNNY